MIWYFILFLWRVFLMHESFIFLKYLALMLVFAKLISEIFHRLKISVVVGKILVGFVLGGSCLGWIDLSQGGQEEIIVKTLGELGVIFMLFYIGLKVRFTEIQEVGLVSIFVALGGVLFPLLMGFQLSQWLFPEEAMATHLFVGTILTATSVAITSHILIGYGLGKTKAAKIILAAAVVDDILSLLTLSVVLTLIKTPMESSHYQGMAHFVHGLTELQGFHLNLALVGLFLFIFLPIFMMFGPKILEKVEKLEGEGAMLVVSIGLMLSMAFLSAQCGLAPIIGAFFFGVIASSADYKVLEKEVEPIYLFLAPIFFVYIGLNLEWEVMKSQWKLALILSAVAIICKFLPCYLMSRLAKVSPSGAILIGFGMVPRGEVGLIVANVGLSMAVIDQRFLQRRPRCALLP